MWTAMRYGWSFVTAIIHLLYYDGVCANKVIQININISKVAHVTFELSNSQMTESSPAPPSTNRYTLFGDKNYSKFMLKTRQAERPALVRWKCDSNGDNLLNVWCNSNVHGKRKRNQDRDRESEEEIYCYCSHRRSINKTGNDNVK